MNRGAMFDYLNSMRLTWFMSYALGIQKVIWRRLRSNFLGTMTAYGAGMAIKDPLGLTNTVPMQNIFNKKWSYTLDPTNTFNGFESHYLMQLLRTIF